MIVINLVNLRIVIALFQTEGDWVQETVRVFTGISAAALVKIFHASRAAVIRNGNQPLRFTYGYLATEQSRHVKHQSIC